MEHVSIWGSVNAVDHRSVAALELMPKGREVMPLALSRYDTLKKKLEPCGGDFGDEQIMELFFPGAWPKKRKTFMGCSHSLLRCPYTNVEVWCTETSILRYPKDPDAAWKTDVQKLHLAFLCFVHAHKFWLYRTDSAMVHAYEHIVIQIRRYYKYNIFKMATKNIVWITENNTYRFFLL